MLKPGDAPIAAFAWQDAMITFDLEAEVNGWRERNSSNLAQPHVTGSNGGDGVIVCVRKRPPLASLDEIAAPATAEGSVDAAAAAAAAAADAVTVDCEVPADADADAITDAVVPDDAAAASPQRSPQRTPRLQMVTRQGYADCDIITALNPVAFVHKPEERLGVPTGRLHSVGHTFDHTFGNHDDNAAVYEAVVQPLVRLTAVEGGVSTILAFGQTGSGKTHTQSYMQEHACAELFETRPAATSVFVSFFENCGDRIFDLLNDREILHIRTGIKEGETDERVHVRTPVPPALSSLEKPPMGLPRPSAVTRSAASRSVVQPLGSVASCLVYAGNRDKLCGSLLPTPRGATDRGAANPFTV